MSYSRSARSLGADPPSAYPASVVSTPAAVTHPYVTMPVCDVQRHLIAAGAAISPDGAWGTQSKTALTNFVRSRPLAESTLVHPNGLPTFGSREDYKFDGQKIRIPMSYAMAFPAMAQVACRGGASTSTSTSSDVVPSDVLETSWTPPGGEGIGSYWPWLAAIAAAAGGYWWWKRSQR